MAEMETVSDIARAESSAMAVEQVPLQQTAANVFDGDSSMAPAAGNPETNPSVLPHRAPTPQSDKMQVDDEF
jgi:hypothetical protein